jgi:ketosteroid isomerase-like protein
MTDDNIEIVKRGFEALDSGGVEAMIELLDPEFEATVPPELSVEPDTYRGHEGMRRYFAAFEGLDDVRFEFVDAVAKGDKVVVTMILRAKGTDTGIPVEQLAHQMWTIRNGKAVRVEAFVNKEDALAAASIENESKRE